MKTDVQRAGFKRTREGRGACAGASGMKALLLALSLLPLAPTPSVARQNDAPRVRTPAPPVEAAKWERFTYPGEEFSAELPEMPLILQNTPAIEFTGDFGKKRGAGYYDRFVEVRVFGLYSSGAVFFITSFSDPRPDESLDYFTSRRWGGASTRVVAEGDLPRMGFEGREYRLSNNKLHGRARVLRTKQRAYLIQVLAFEENHPSVGRFLNSFELPPRPSGRAIVRAEMPAYTSEARSAGDAGAGILKSSEVERRALIVYKTEPRGTPAARRKNTRGVVRLRAVLAASGKVENISVIQGLPDGLTEDAVYASRHLLFFPALKDGKEVPQSVILEYHYG